MIPLDDRPEWFDQALCRGLTHLFFPEKGGQESDSEARKLCRVCPVRRECAARGEREADGIWGGITHSRSSQRGRGQRPLQPIRHATFGGYMAHRRRGEDACPSCMEAKNRYAESVRQTRAS